MARSVVAVALGACVAFTPARGADLGDLPRGDGQPPAVPSVVIRSDGSVFDPQVRVDLPPMPDRRHLAVERMLRRLELAMRVTARDMARGDVVFLDGLPGYKVPDDSEVRRIVVDGLKEVPLGQLPGGRELARLVRTLPNTAGLDVEAMSYRELLVVVRDRQRVAVERLLGPYFSEHEVQAGALALAALSGIRAASPEMAGLIDALKPRVRVWSEHGRLASVNATLVYRKREILPNLDLEARAELPLDQLRLYGRLRTQLSLEADRHATTTATAGLTAGDMRGFVDASAELFDDGHQRLSVLFGKADPDTGLVATTNLSAELMRRPPFRDTPRYGVEVDLNMPVRIAGTTEGWFGVYGAAFTDADGRNEELRGGLVFGLRW